MIPLRFFVPGTAAPGGSKKAFRHATTGRVIVTDDAKGNRDWRRQVALFASQAMAGRELFTGPIEVTLTFRVKRPLGHYRTGKNAGKLRDAAPEFPTGKPDVLKLARAVEDALTGVVYQDDSRTVTIHAHKRYTSPTAPTGVEIVVETIGQRQQDAA